jgi:hypothetical protein
MDLWVSRGMRCEKPPRAEIPNSLVWLLGSCAVLTNFVITLYWEVQWTCGFFHWKANFKMVPWSTQSAPELLVLKSYDQIIMKVRTCPNWLSELMCTDLSEFVRTELAGSSLSELIYLFLFLCFLSVYSCTTPLTYIPKYNQCRTFR